MLMASSIDHSPPFTKSRSQASALCSTGQGSPRQTRHLCWGSSQSMRTLDCEMLPLLRLFHCVTSTCAIQYRTASSLKPGILTDLSFFVSGRIPTLFWRISPPTLHTVLVGIFINFCRITNHAQT